MNKIYRLLPLVLVVSLAACSSPEEPLAGSDMEARSASSRPHGVASEGSWQPTTLTQAALTGERSAVERALAKLDDGPSLYDLHHPRGALALSGFIYGSLVLDILESAGYETAIDEVRGEFSLGGEKRSLWLHYDHTRLELPETKLRWSLPSRVGIISVTENGVQRLSDGESMGAPAQPSELAGFAARWAQEVGVSSPRRVAPSRIIPSQDLTILPGEVMMNGLDFDIEGFAAELELTLEPDGLNTLTLRPDPDSSFGDLVALLQELYLAYESGLDLQFALPLPGREEAPVHGLRFDSIVEPMMVLKVDRRTPWSRIAPMLNDLSESLPEVVLMTNLDVSDPQAITDETYLGGLPGGLPLVLAPVEEDRERITVARGEDWMDFESESFQNETSAFAEADARTARPAPRYPSPPPPPAPEDLGPVHVGGDVTEPVLISRPDAVYTEDARQVGVQGVVIIQAIVDRNGKVTNAKTLKGLSEGLTESAIRAVKASRYEPAEKNGEPVDVYLNIVVNFELDS